MTPLTTIADATDIYTARKVVDALKRAGFVVVDKGAIGRAQREAVRQYEEDNDNKPKAKTLAPNWSYNKDGAVIGGAGGGGYYD